MRSFEPQPGGEPQLCGVLPHPPLARPEARARVAPKGFNLVEMLIGLAILSILAAAGLPLFFRSTARLRVSLAGREIGGVLHLARLYAIRHGTNVAVKFRTTPDGFVTFALYRDGDGDGVRNRDIDAGVDPEVMPQRRLAHLGRAVRFGFPPGRQPRHPSTGRLMDRLDDPIRFNRSDLASFSPVGAATPGSLYISDQRTNLIAVRVLNRTGRVRLQRYDYEEETWHEI